MSAAAGAVMERVMSEPGASCPPPPPLLVGSGKFELLVLSLDKSISLPGAIDRVPLLHPELTPSHYITSTGTLSCGA